MTNLFMTRDTKMLQSILTGVADIREDIERLNKKINGVEERLTERIDKLGGTIAYLEDDTPTMEEFEKLEKRVTKIEKQRTLN